MNVIPNLLVGRNAGKGTGREIFLPCWTWISCAFVLFGSRQKAAELSWALKKFCCIFCMEKIVMRTKRVRWLSRERRQGFPGLFPLSGRQTGSGSDPWSQLRDSRNSSAGIQPPPGKPLLAQLEEQGSPHRLYLARGHSKF